MTVLYDGAPARSVRMKAPMSGFDAYYVEADFSHNRSYGVTPQEYIDEYGQFWQLMFGMEYANDIFQEAFPFTLSGDGTTLDLNESGKTVSRIVGIEFNDQ